MRNIDNILLFIIAIVVTGTLIGFVVIHDIKEIKETDRFIESIVTDTKEENDKVIQDFINTL